MYVGIGFICVLAAWASTSILTDSVVVWPAECYSFFLFFFFPGYAVLQLHTNVFTYFTALLLCCCVSFCSLLDGVCLSGNKRITYLLY